MVCEHDWKELRKSDYWKSFTGGGRLDKLVQEGYLIERYCSKCGLMTCIVDIVKSHTEPLD